MYQLYDTYAKVLVALRKESVDRNLTFPPIMTLLRLSLSARRAWIEIGDHHHEKH